MRNMVLIGGNGIIYIKKLINRLHCSNGFIPQVIDGKAMKVINRKVIEVTLNLEMIFTLEQQKISRVVLTDDA